jgi:hypothetical protein
LRKTGNNETKIAAGKTGVFPVVIRCWMEVSLLTPARNRFAATAEAISAITVMATAMDRRLRREDSEADAEGRSAPIANPITRPPRCAALLMPGSAPKARL